LLKSKFSKLLFGTVMVFMLFTSASTPASGSSWSWEITDGLNILIVAGDAFYSDAASMDTFKMTYEAAGTNNVTVVESYDFANFASSNYDALLISAIQGDNWFNTANLTEIVDWFDDGHKLLWVAGNSDFGGDYQSNSTSNPVLEAVKSNLRLDGGAIEDPQSSDGSAYRVIANTTGVSSDLTDYVVDDGFKAIFHGPTSVLFYDYSGDGEYMDLRNQTIADYNIDIVANSSKAANALDQDASLGAWDYYAYANGVNGSYPMLATQQLNSSLVVASGEVTFSDYKFMYGLSFEKSGLTHDGAKTVDRLFDYWFVDQGNNADATLTERIPIITQTNTVTDTETETETATETSTATTTTTTAPFFAWATIAVLAMAPVALGLKRKFD
jgi:hypothetical protein